MPRFLHQELAAGGWAKRTLLEQLGNIGSEVSRAKKSQGKDNERFQNAVERALDLFDMTLEDPRWNGRKWEIARAREVFCDTVYGDKQYKTTLNDLDHYFTQFAYAAMNARNNDGR